MLLGTQVPDWLDLLKHVPVEDLLLPLLLQLAIIIVAARMFGVLFRRLGQPSVVGEIAAGLILGPSLLGRLFPAAWRALFHPALPNLPPELGEVVLGTILTVLSQLGLVLLLFLVGLEFDFGHLRRYGPAALTISAAGIALPFGLGVGLAWLMLPHVWSSEAPTLGFTLFLGTALSITAIPVLGRIMMELNITQTRLGTITIAAAAVDDACGWTLLATVTAVVQSRFEPLATVRMIAETLGFTAIMIFLARPLLSAWLRRSLRHHGGELTINSLAMLLAAVLICALVTNLIGIFAIFGAFLLGAMLSGERELRRAVARRLQDVVTAFFLPIYFTYTGLRTDVGTLESWPLWGWCGLVLGAAVVGKLGGCGLAAWQGGFSLREAACVGTLMNARGLMELIVINLGKDLGVVPDRVYCMLVLMALTTTVMTTPLLLRLMPGTELEGHIRASGFVAATPTERPATAAVPR